MGLYYVRRNYVYSFLLHKDSLVSRFDWFDLDRDHIIRIMSTLNVRMYIAQSFVYL